MLLVELLILCMYLIFYDKNKCDIHPVLSCLHFEISWVSNIISINIAKHIRGEWGLYSFRVRELCIPSKKSFKKWIFFSLNVYKDFHGGPGVKTLPFNVGGVKTLPSNAGGMGSIPGQGAKISHASRPKKSKHKTETVLWQSQKTLKMVPIKTNLKNNEKIYITTKCGIYTQRNIIQP